MSKVKANARYYLCYIINFLYYTFDKKDLQLILKPTICVNIFFLTVCETVLFYQLAFF